MSDSADRNDGPTTRASPGPRDDRRSAPDPQRAELEGDGFDGERRGGASDDGPSRLVDLLGTAGVYLAAGSLLAAAVGIVGIIVGAQPYGNIATTIALGGVTVAMVLGMVYQASVADYRAE